MKLVINTINRLLKLHITHYIRDMNVVNIVYASPV